MSYRKGSALLVGVVGLIVVLLIAGTLFGIWWGTRATAITKDEGAAEALSNVKVVLKRRFDLIPKLAQAVKAYMTHEQKVFIETAEVRSKQLTDQLSGSNTPSEIDKVASEGKEISDNVIVTVRAVTEAYPELKADQVVMSYMDELAGTENRIYVARERYNAAAKDLNIFIKTDLWYSIFWRGLVEERAYFDISSEEENPPPTDL